MSHSGVRAKAMSPQFGPLLGDPTFSFWNESKMFVGIMCLFWLRLGTRSWSKGKAFSEGGSYLGTCPFVWMCSHSTKEQRCVPHHRAFTRGMQVGRTKGPFIGTLGFFRDTKLINGEHPPSLEQRVLKHGMVQKS